MSSTRVMGTCSSMGQAVGTAAAMALARGTDPRGMLERVGDLQQALLRDDCYLPWTPCRYGAATRSARITAPRGDGDFLRDGFTRPIGSDSHGVAMRLGESVTYELAGPARVDAVSLVLDSALDETIAMSWHQRDDQLTSLPRRMPRAFHVEVREGGRWSPVARADGNRSRLVRIAVDRTVEAARYTLDETYGADESVLFAFYVD